MDKSIVTELFPNAEAEDIVCAACGEPREVIIGPLLPGVTPYRRCACGALGIARQGDLYEAPRLKKATRVCYWERSA